MLQLPKEAPKEAAPQAIERRTNSQRSPLGEVWVRAKAIHGFNST